MRTIGQKIADARSEKGLRQSDLGEMTGLSGRSISYYESGEKYPRKSAILKLAKALDVSTKFLTDDECENPFEDIDKDYYIEAARDSYGASGQRDMELLLAENKALFAGGDLTEEQKDEYFQAIMMAYVACKEAAKKKYGRKDSPDKEK